MIAVAFWEPVPVVDLCHDYGNHPTMFYRWQQILFENGTLIFERTSKSAEGAQSRKTAALEAKLQKKDAAPSARGTNAPP